MAFSGLVGIAASIESMVYQDKYNDALKSATSVESKVNNKITDENKNYNDLIVVSAELVKISIALKAVGAILQKKKIPTIIFDRIDAASAALILSSLSTTIVGFATYFEMYNDFRYGRNLVAGSAEEARYNKLSRGAKYAKGVGLVIDVAAAISQIINMIMMAKQYQEAIDKLNDARRDIEASGEAIDETLAAQKTQIGDINKALDDAWPIFNQTRDINKSSMDYVEKTRTMFLVLRDYLAYLELAITGARNILKKENKTDLHKDFADQEALGKFLLGTKNNATYADEWQDINYGSMRSDIDEDQVITFLQDFLWLDTMTV